MKLIILFCCLLLNLVLKSQDPLLTNPAGIIFVLIKPGSFNCGKFDPPYPQPDSASSERGYRKKDYNCAEKLAKKDARPGFHVKIGSAFYMGKFEVTQKQWKNIMGTNPSIFKGDDHPVDNITWSGAILFLKKLNELDREHFYRLPTEFEWEYAARAGAVDDISWDEIRLQAQIGTNTTNEVGSKKPNAWGLYDMLGNVWEWTSDLYNEKIFADPEPPEAGTQHVLKGASFTGDVKNATYMTHAAGPGNKWDVGFRVVMENRNSKTLMPQIANLITKNDSDGWHISRTSHQGTTPYLKIKDGVITLKQHPFGQGGILLSNKKYRDFELYVEVKLDSFCNSGIFLRSTESGQAYQIELAEPGGTGNLLGEMLKVSKTAEAVNMQKVWKQNGWNAFRIRMVGEVPHISLWINGEHMWDVVEPVNDFIAGAKEGMIGFQAHWSATYSPASQAFDMSGSWRPGSKIQFRNISIKEINE